MGAMASSIGLEEEDSDLLRVVAVEAPAAVSDATMLDAGALAVAEISLSLLKVKTSTSI